MSAAATNSVAGWVLMAVALVSGQIGSRVPERAPVMAGGYRVLSADFHTHSAFWSDGAQSPAGLVLTARLQGLDIIGITAHNQVSDAKFGRWFSYLIDGPTVIVGQELVSPTHHMIALGTERQIDAKTVEAQIEEVRAQNGVIIVAHPTKEYWPMFDDRLKGLVDGAEVCHAVSYSPKRAPELEHFREGQSLGAIGSSDFHGVGRIGACRTYVFVKVNTPAGILEALRAKRTVVYTPNGKTFGDPALAALIADRQDLREVATKDAPVPAIDWVSRIAGLAGLVLLVKTRAGRSARATKPSFSSAVES